MARRYISADEFKARPLGIAVRQYTDEMLNDYIEVASTAIEDLCDRVFSEDEYTETLKGSGSEKLLLTHYPLTDITSISATSISDGTTSTIDPDDLVRTDISDSSGILELNGDVWAPTYLYEVTYTAGYDPVPAPVRHATAVWVSELLKPDFAGPTMDVPDIVPFSTQQIVELLTPYKRRHI